MLKKRLEINGINYQANIKDGEIYGISYIDKNFTKVMLKKFDNAYTTQITTRFSNIAKFFN